MALRSKRFTPETRDLIGEMVAIVTQYAAQGYRMTARQLYYQLVTQNIVLNEERSYKRVTKVLSDARYNGFISWDAIEDRGRRAKVPAEWPSLRSIVNSAINSFRLPRWEKQPCYVELWVEKDALAGVLAPLANRHHIPLMVNKGYSSSSAMKECAERFRREAGSDDADAEYDWEDVLLIANDKKEVSPKDRARFIVDEMKGRDRTYNNVDIRPSYLFYLGDLDPSGEDMVRDIEARLREFGVFKLEVEKIGITPAQVQQYNPPPNPVKVTDGRAAAYIAEHGHSSWEVDALPPNVLAQIVESAILGVRDADAWEEVLAAEQAQKSKLRTAMDEVLPEIEDDDEDE